MWGRCRIRISLFLKPISIFILNKITEFYNLRVCIYLPGSKCTQGLEISNFKPITVNFLWQLCTIPTIIAYTVGFSRFDNQFIIMHAHVLLYCIFYFVFSNNTSYYGIPDRWLATRAAPCTHSEIRHILARAHSHVQLWQRHINRSADSTEHTRFVSRLKKAPWGPEMHCNWC